MSAKVLVLGAARGHLKAYFTKATILHSKQNFSFAIATGDLFGESDDEEVSALLDGSVQIPLPTYFTIGTYALPPRIAERIIAGEEIAPNLQFLYKRSITKTSSGVRIAALGGLFDPDSKGLSTEHHTPVHSAEDVSSMKGANSADILVTAIWPDQVWSSSRTPLTGISTQSIPKSWELANLCIALKPLYILTSSPGDVFFETSPFYFDYPVDNPTSTTVTRFLSFGPFNNPAKAKSLYAFNLPASKLNVEAATPSPFLAQQRKRPASDTDNERHNRGRADSGRPGGGERHGGKRHRPTEPQQCFMCLDNDAIGAHMIASIGNNSFLASAKGPLSTSETYVDVGMNFPSHMMIVSMEHGATVATMKDDPDAVFGEMKRYRNSLQSMAAHTSKRQLGGVTWEISTKNSVHVHWQFIPVPADKILSGLAEAAFKVEAENSRFVHGELLEPPIDLADAIVPLENKHADFFRLWLWAEREGEDQGGGKTVAKTLVMDLTMSKFEFQYPRRVIGKLLGLDSRLQWKDCAQSQEEEEADIKKFRQAWTDWDFTAADGYIQD